METAVMVSVFDACVKKFKSYSWSNSTIHYERVSNRFSVCCETKLIFKCPSEMTVYWDGKLAINVSDKATLQEHWAVLVTSILKGSYWVQ